VPPGEPVRVPRFADPGGPDDDNAAETMLGLPGEVPTHTAIRKDVGAAPKPAGKSPDGGHSPSPEKPAKA
jgi:hypothetical protein